VLAKPAFAQHEDGVRLVKLFQTNRTFYSQFNVAKEIVGLDDPGVSTRGGASSNAALRVSSTSGRTNAIAYKRVTHKTGHPTS